MPNQTNRLTVAEGNRLQHLEGVIRDTEDAARRMIDAYIEIRDRKLYRAHHATFEEYCRVKWGVTQGRINQLRRAEEVREGLPPGIDTLVSNERAARALIRVPEQDREATVRAAAAAGPVNARTITEAASRQNAQTVELDATGYPIPRALMPLWQRRSESDALLTQLSRIRSLLAAAQRDGDVLWAEVNFSATVGDLDKAYTALKASKPYAVCFRCQGHPETQAGECRLCKGRGVIGEFMYRTVPEEERNMRNGGGR